MKVKITDESQTQQIQVNVKQDPVDELVLGLRSLDLKDFKRAVASAKIYRRADARMEA